MKFSTLVLAALLASFVASSPAQQPSPPTNTITKEQTVYVPFEKLEQVFENQERGVFLPYREFLELWNKLNLPDQIKKTEPPVDGVLAAAHYTGIVEGDAVVMKAKLDLEALKEGWSVLKLGAGQLNIADVKSNANLNVRDGNYEVIFPNKGKYESEMTIYGKVTRETGRSTLHLNLPRTAVSQFELVIPEKGLDFTITPASAFTSAEQPDGSTKLAVYFGASQEINIAWQKRAGETALTPLLFAETSAAVRLSAGAVRTTLDVQYRILRTGVSTFEILVPSDQQVLNVDGQNLRDWTLQPADKMQRLMVNLHTPARDNYTLRINMETSVQALPAKIALPACEVKNVERQSGSVTISADPELVVEAGDLAGLTQQAAVIEKGNSLVGQYRYLRLPYSARLSISQTEPVVEVTSDALVTIEPETKYLTAKFNYEVKKAGIFFARIALPAGFAQAEAKGEAVESSSVQKVGDKNILEVKFRSRRTGAFSFDINAEAARKTPDEALTVPVFTPLNVQRYEARVGVAIHVSLKANTTDPGDLRQEDIRNMKALPVRDPETAPLTLGFRYRGEAKPAQVAFELRKPRVSVEVLALTEVREALIKNEWRFNYNVEYAGVNEFSIAVPKAIADDIQIDGDDIKERTRSDEKNEKGEPTGNVIWKVSLQDKRLGQFQLRVSLETPQTQLKQGSAADVNLYELRPLNVFRETGQVAVLKDGNLEFTATDAKGLELIDPKELSDELQREGIFLAYKYAAHPIALHLSIAKNLYLDVPSALVTYAVLNSVVAGNKAETTEVIYWVLNKSQQFFSIQLPPGGRMLSDAFVNGVPQQPSRRPDNNEVLIRLPAALENEACAVRFVYEVPSKRANSGLWPRGTINVQPPAVAGTGVLQTKWTLYLPNGYRYVKFGGAMKEAAGRWGWDRFRRLADFFVPQVGPQVRRDRANSWNEPPATPKSQASGFDFQIPKEGASVVLRRLDAPAAITIHYRSKTYANIVEAILFFAAFFFGVRLVNRPRESRFSYAMFVGVGALIIAGAVAPRAAGMWTAIYLGVLLAAVVWIVRGAWITQSRWRERRRERKAARAWQPPPMPPTPPAPQTPAAPQV